MKRLIPYILVSSFAFTSALFTTEPKEHPSDIMIKAQYSNVSEAKFSDTNSQKGHKLGYQEGQVLGIYQHALENQRKASIGVGYMQTKFHFSHHPRKTSFSQENFENILFHFSATSRELARWKWKTTLNVQTNADHFSLSQYSFFEGKLHGKYQYHESRNLHVGVLALTGMRYTRLLPIVGMDFVFSKKWELNAVFPKKMALVYTMTPQWKLNAAIRYFLSRQRLGEHEHYRRGLVAYRNWGAELGVNYIYSRSIRFNLHVGESFDGRLRISAKSGSQRQHLRLDSALYYGFSATLAF